MHPFLLLAGKQCLLFLLLLLLLLHALILFSATSAAIAAAAALDNSTDLSSLLAFKAATTTSGGGDASSDNINIATNWTTDAPSAPGSASAAAGIGRGSSPSTSAASPCKIMKMLFPKIDLKNGEVQGKRRVFSKHKQFYSDGQQHRHNLVYGSSTDQQEESQQGEMSTVLEFCCLNQSQKRGQSTQCSAGI